jgi:hypothetical protein
MEFASGADFWPRIVVLKPLESLPLQARTACWRDHPGATASDVGVDLTPFSEMH